MSLCEKNCNFTSYDSTSKKVECQCKVKTTFSSLSDLYKSQTNLLFNFDIDEAYLIEDETDSIINNTQSNINIPLINNSSISEILNLFTNFFKYKCNTRKSRK